MTRLARCFQFQAALARLWLGRRVQGTDLRRSRWSRPCPRLWQRAAHMPGVELSTSAFDGHALVALRGELDVTGAAEAEAAITALVAASVDAAVASIARRRSRYPWRRLAVRTARLGRAAPSRTG